MRTDQTDRRALARLLLEEGDPRAAHLRRPGRPGASPEQRAADQRLVVGLLDHLTRCALATKAGVSRSTIGYVAAGKRALSPETRRRVQDVAAARACPGEVPGG
jgi:hypothetical protein